MTKRIFILFFTCLLLINSSFSHIKADKNIYYLFDYKSNEEIDEYANYKDAKKAYEDLVDEYDNLALLKNDEVLEMEYGIVSFDAEVIDYTLLSGSKKSFESKYAKDGLYIKSLDKTIEFSLFGDRGFIEKEKVTLIPFEALNTRISSYEVKNGLVYHNIKTYLNYDYYTYSLVLNKAPAFLKDGIYYSSDGIYFYSDFYGMIEDLRSGERDFAENGDNPYFNYYAYLPYRSYTNYSYEELESYFYKTLGIDGKLSSYRDFSNDGANDVINLSQYYGEIDNFVGYQYLYGTNAMLLLASSIKESSYGKNLEAYENNRLFKYSAYDREYERENGRYLNPDSSIYSYAKYYISRAFCGFGYDKYAGSFLGNFGSGIGASYSLDPYESEKAASEFFKLDKNLGYKDLNSYTLGIIENLEELNIYKDEELSEKIIKLKNLNYYSLIILEENDDSYLVQIDDSSNNAYLYNPINCVGYIAKEEIDYVAGKKEIEGVKYDTYHFDFNGGDLHYMESADIFVKENQKPVLPEASADGYEFVSYKEIDDRNLIADYKEISRIELKNFNNTQSYGQPLNYDGAYLKVTYNSFLSKNVPLDSSMISFEDDETILIAYNGLKASEDIDYVYDEDEYEDELKETIAEVIEQYQNEGTYNSQTLEKIQKILGDLNYEFSFKELRELDKVFFEATKDEVNYSYGNFRNDISLSGLSLGIRKPNLLSVFKPFKDTYFARMGAVSSNRLVKVQGVGEAYGLRFEDSFRLSLTLNLASSDLKTPLIISMQVSDMDNGRIYSIYHIDGDGNIIKCKSQQSDDYVYFMGYGTGDYVIFSIDSANTYKIENIRENISIENADPDNHLLFLYGSLIVVFAIVGLCLIIIHIELDKREDKLWNDYKKSLHKVVWRHAEKPKN